MMCSRKLCKDQQMMMMMMMHLHWYWNRQPSEEGEEEYRKEDGISDGEEPPIRVGDFHRFLFNEGRAMRQLKVWHLLNSCHRHRLNTLLIQYEYRVQRTSYVRTNFIYRRD